MPGRVSDRRAHLWLGGMETMWLSLHHENPEVGGAYASEIIGSGYARQKMLFTEPNARAIFSMQAVSWSGLPQVTVAYVGAWDAQFNGNLEAFFELPDAQYVTSGGRVSFAAGEVALSID